MTQLRVTHSGCRKIPAEGTGKKLKVYSREKTDDERKWGMFL
jgi:hypothetical protein